jgi:hypothetical protein
MLPGFRFLFAAIMLSMSLLIFGLGAAALLRAAHESFASNSSWHASPDVPFAQRPESTLPMLATLRVEPVTEKANDEGKVAAAPAEAAPSPAGAAATDQVAALKPVEAPAVDAVKPENAFTDVLGAQNARLPETTPAAVSPASAALPDETRMAPVPDTSSANSTPVTSQPERTTTAAVAPSTNPVPLDPTTTPEADSAITKIATLGGPPVEITDDTSALEIRMVKIPRARPDQDAVKKRVQARRALHRRRLALRARLAAQQLLQQQNPFAQPVVPAATTRQRQPSVVTP